MGEGEACHIEGAVVGQVVGSVTQGIGIAEDRGSSREEGSAGVAVRTGQGLGACSILGKGDAVNNRTGEYARAVVISNAQSISR